MLVELSQLEGGGGRHGAILAQQMMDVAIRFVDSHKTLLEKLVLKHNFSDQFHQGGSNQAICHPTDGSARREQCSHYGKRPTKLER